MVKRYRKNARLEFVNSFIVCSFAFLFLLLFGRGNRVKEEDFVRFKCSKLITCSQGSVVLVERDIQSTY